MTGRYEYQVKIYIPERLLNILLVKIVLIVMVLCKDNFQPSTSTDKETHFQWQGSLDVPKTTADYYFNDYNLDDDYFQIENDYCKNTSIFDCSEFSFNYQSYPDKLCHCDKLCGLMNDCCGNYEYPSILPLTNEQIECVPSYGIVKNREYGVYMVTKCSPRWGYMITKRLCEDDVRNDDNILFRLPVSDTTEYHVMYKNMYCAQCNFVIDFLYWKQDIICKNETGVRTLAATKDCNFYILRPSPDISHRTCQLLHTIISYCDQSVETTTHEIENKCINGVYGIVYDDSGRMYRNKYCAMCNGVDEAAMFCEQTTVIPTIMPPPPDPRTGTYSLRTTVDINTGTVSYEEKEGQLRSEETIQCKDNEVLDGYSQKCREIYCAPQFVALNGKCITSTYNQSLTQEFTHEQRVKLENCTFTKLNPSEYELRKNPFTNESELFIFSHQKVYSMDRVHNGSDVYVCQDNVQNCSHGCRNSKGVLYSDLIERYLTLVGLIISILSLAVTLAVYITFPQLLNTPGKILMSLIISLLLAQILFLSAAESENVDELCILVGILIHYFFLAAFCWMNVIAFDLWMTFSNRFMTPVSDRKGQKRFVMYSIYAWFLPVAVVSIAIILDFVKFDDSLFNLKPGYGDGVCWISSRNSRILFFAGPLAIFKIFDIISFISTAVHISRAKKQGAMATKKKNTCSFIVNIKLSLIMGLTWVFAFVANATNETSMWYLFIIFNSLQGLFIAICFLCTKKVGRLIKDKYQQATTKTVSGTQITSLS